VPALLPLLDSPDATCRYEAALALGRIGDKAASAGEALGKLLKDPDLKIRRLTAQWIGDTKSPAAVPALLAALGDEDRQVRLYAGFSLRKIDPQLAAQHGYW
jgi:HEAT repeat protein